MARPALLLCLFLALCAPARAAALPAAAQSAPTVRVEVLAELPHDPRAFTEGLLFLDGRLYESTGKYGRSSLRVTDPTTGRVLRQTRLDERFFAEGLALVRGRLVQLTWQEGTGFLYDPAGLERLGSFGYQGEGWGLACDGKTLVRSDGSDILAFLDPDDFRVLGRLPVRDGERPVNRLNELEFAEGRLLANIWWEDRVAVIDRGTGRVLLWLDLSPLRARLTNPEAEAANGLAYDPGTGRLYATGKFWDKVFVLRLPRLP